MEEALAFTPCGHPGKQAQRGAASCPSTHSKWVEPPGSRGRGSPVCPAAHKGSPGEGEAGAADSSSSSECEAGGGPSG